MNFEEANRRSRELKQQYDAGHLTSTQFDEQREQLKVQDDQGRWWAKGRGEGDWYYYDGRTWVQGIPPGYGARTVQPPHDPGIRGPGMNVPGYLLPASIGTTLLCCPATGIAAIVYSVQASSKSQAGDSAGASQATKNANTWLMVSLVAGLIFYFLFFIVGLAGA